MCETSNRPTLSRTALCSLIVPAVYCTGMCQPPKSINFAPSWRCTSCSGVLRRTSMATLDTSLFDGHVAMRHRRISLATSDLEVRATVALERAHFSPAETSAPRDHEPRVTDLGVRAKHRRAIRIEVRRDDHVLGNAGQLAFDLERRRARGEVNVRAPPLSAVDRDVAKLIQAMALAVEIERHHH